MAINLNKYSFEQWVAFVFDHPVSESAEKRWYWQDEWEHEADHSLMLEYLIRLFRNPTFLLDTYSPEQLEQGFWFIHRPIGLFEEALRDPNVKWQLRRECILSMGDLFERLFAVNPLESACYMWWDLLISGYFGPWHHTWDPPMVDDKDLQAQQAIFETLCRILKLESRECQKAALHGLGHLNHPLTEQTIEAFLNENPRIDGELKQYAIKSIKGEIQ